METYLITAITCLAGAVAYLFKEFRNSKNKTESKLDETESALKECEIDRLQLRREIATLTLRVVKLEPVSDT